MQVEKDWKNSRTKYDGFSIVVEDGFVRDQAKSFLNLGKSLVENKAKVPEHVVIIPDGNRRWARSRGLSASFGHYTSGGYDHLIELFKEAKKYGVRYLSLWGFSTENWNRDEKEIKAIFDLIVKGVPKFRKVASAERIRFRHLGRKDRMPGKVVEALRDLEKETRDNRDFNVQLCLDYGGRDEIIRAVNKALKLGKKINGEDFKELLDTKGIPDPDFIIRTSGERRVSGMMPYQAAYAEFYFSDLYFPDFDATEFRRALKSFGKRIRRYGGTAKEDLK